jgi:hypothetical protein
MTIKVELTCPLGSKCEVIVGDTIKKCAWYTKLAGTNPNTGEQVDEHGCAIAWLPMLLIENSMQQRSTSAAVESFRNETVQANQTTQQIMLAQRDPRLL